MRRLREIAEAATPGPWESRCYGLAKDSWGVHSEQYGAVAITGTDLGEPGAKVDAEHMAAFDPPTVLALLDVAEAASLHTDDEDSCITYPPCGDCRYCLLDAALARLREVSDG